MWLLSKGRVAEAEKSLCWLRGWVPASSVQNELKDLIRYSDASKLVLKEKKPKPPKNAPPTYSNPVNLEDEASPTEKTNGQIAKPAEGPDVVKCSNEPNGNIALEPKKVENGVVSESTAIAGVERKATVKELILDMARPEMLRPLSLVIAFFVFHNGSGFPAIRPYMVNVFEQLRFPVDAHWATVS